MSTFFFHSYLLYFFSVASKLRTKIKPIKKKKVAIWNEEFYVDLIFYSIPNCDHFSIINLSILLIEKIYWKKDYRKLFLVTTIFTIFYNADVAMRNSTQNFLNIFWQFRFMIMIFIIWFYNYIILSKIIKSEEILNWLQVYLKKIWKKKIKKYLGWETW